MTTQKQKPLKSIRSLASELKSRRKPKLTSLQIKKANRIFEEIDREQNSIASSRKIAKDVEV